MSGPLVVVVHLPAGASVEPSAVPSEPVASEPAPTASALEPSTAPSSEPTVEPSVVTVTAPAAPGEACGMTGLAPCQVVPAPGWDAALGVALFLLVLLASARLALAVRPGRHS